MPRLLLRAGLTSSGIMTVADILAQGIERRVLGSTPDNPRDYDPYRTARFAVVGLTLHGPYFQRGFAMVDRRFGPSLSKAGKPAWGVIAKKVGTTQFALNAPFMVCLFAWMGVLEGRREPAAVWDNVKQKWPAAFWAGNVFWPCANFVNFRFLGPQHRVAYVASCGAVWNTYISVRCCRPPAPAASPCGPVLTRSSLVAPQLLNQYKDEEQKRLAAGEAPRPRRLAAGEAREPPNR